MSRIIKNVICAALISMCVGASFLQADVKLRIYLQDGSLRAGNLVTETEKTFVILSKTGREEIPKSKIMFVNGKSLAQWQAHPDKFFQTEIIPSEIPNPSYVNDKASLPPPVQVPAKLSPIVMPQEVQAEPMPVTASAASASVSAAKAESSEEENSDDSQAEKPSSTSDSAVRHSPPAEPAKVTPVVPAVVKESTPIPTPTAKPTSTPVPVKEKEAEAAATPVVRTTPVMVPTLAPLPKKLAARPHRVKRHQELPMQEPAKEAPRMASVETATTKAMPATVEASAVVKPAFYSRDGYAKYHHDRALELIKSGDTGRAIQELHMATMLNKFDEEGIVLLGKLYAGEGTGDRATKILSSPFLRRNMEAKKMINDIAESDKKNETNRQVLWGELAGGIVVSLAMTYLIHRLRRKKISARTIVADNLVDNLSPEAVASTVQDMLREIRIESGDAAAATEPDELNQPDIDSPAAPEAPVVPTEMPPMPAFLSSAPPAQPPQLIPEVPVKVSTPIELHVEPPQAPLPAMDAPTFDREEILRTQQTIDLSIQKGNEYAYKGQNEKARREYRTALALEATNVSALLGLGYLAFMDGQWEMALDYYVKALELAPNSADAHYGVGRVLLETDREKEAISELQKALLLDPTLTDARDTLTALGAAA